MDVVDRTGHWCCHKTRKKIPAPARLLDDHHDAVRDVYVNTRAKTDDTLTTEASCRRSVLSA